MAQYERDAEAVSARAKAWRDEYSASAEPSINLAHSTMGGWHTFIRDCQRFVSGERCEKRRRLAGMSVHCSASTTYGRTPCHGRVHCTTCMAVRLRPSPPG